MDSANICTFTPLDRTPENIKDFTALASGLVRQRSWRRLFFDSQMLRFEQKESDSMWHYCFESYSLIFIQDPFAGPFFCSKRFLLQNYVQTLYLSTLLQQHVPWSLFQCASNQISHCFRWLLPTPWGWEKWVWHPYTSPNCPKDEFMIIYNSKDNQAIREDPSSKMSSCRFLPFPSKSPLVGSVQMLPGLHLNHSEKNAVQINFIAAAGFLS